MKKIIYVSIISAVIFSGCEKIETGGCIDPLAVNYESWADYDDGSCLYVWGCTDPEADNWNPEAVMEEMNECEYSCNVVYYLDYSAAQYMNNWGISYYEFYDYNGFDLGYITSNYYWTSPPNCIPQTDGSTLTASLSWDGNYGSNTAIYSFSAYPDDGPIPDYDGTFVVYPNECISVELSQQQIQDYKDSH
jgi:hypothetical protein